MFFFLAISPEASIELIKKPNKKRFSREVVGSHNILDRKRSKDVNYYQNFTLLMTQIKSSEELSKKIQNIFQNLWCCSHQKMKILELNELETMYYSQLKTLEKMDFSLKYTSKFIIIRCFFC